MCATSYLIRNGWRPAPTVFEEIAFEHDTLTLVPKAFTKSQGTYVKGHVRMPKTAALSVQLVEERRIYDCRLSYTESLMTILAKFVFFMHRDLRKKLP